MLFRRVATDTPNRPQSVLDPLCPTVENKWPEDFAGFAETRSSSRSVQLRHITQPAFSRRIQALDILGSLQAMRGHQAAGLGTGEFTLPHSVAFTFFPNRVMQLRKHFGIVRSRLSVLNGHDAVMRLSEGSFARPWCRLARCLS